MALNRLLESLLLFFTPIVCSCVYVCVFVSKEVRDMRSMLKLRGIEEGIWHLWMIK